MNTSESIKNISAALVAFHKEVGKIRKDASNPFFKSKYASLPNILDVIEEPLINNGLAIAQFPEGEHGLTSRLIHISGEWMESNYTMKPVKDTPQDRGSAITYQRRYAIGAILSLSIDEDDDGEKANGRSVKGTNGKEVKDEKPWLNENTKEFKDVIFALKENKCDMKYVESKFRLSQKIKAILEGALEPVTQ